MQYLTYVKQSTIPEYGKGLFARSTIKAGHVIAEFKGNLQRKNMKQLRSAIEFNDGLVLVCPNNDRASFANDAVFFPTTKRHLVDALQSEEPFYPIHPAAALNAQLAPDDEEHRAYLFARRDIKKDEEIFLSYGFWF